MAGTWGAGHGFALLGESRGVQLLQSGGAVQKPGCSFPPEVRDHRRAPGWRGPPLKSRASPLFSNAGWLVELPELVGVCRCPVCFGVGDFP